MTNTPSAMQNQSSPDGDGDLAGSAILLVDDNEQNLELLHAYLEALPCEVRTARDGVEAMEAVAAARPDIILLDVMMPRMSGFQVCDRLKSDVATRDIPIIMVTALNEVNDIVRAIDLGVDDFLTKPVNRLELLTRVRSLMRLSHMQKRLNKTLAELRRLGPGGPGTRG